MSVVRNSPLFAALLVAALAALPSRALEEGAAPSGHEPATKPEAQETEEASEADESNLRVEYDDGLKLETKDGRFSAKINLRGQFRGSRLSSSDLDGESDPLSDETGAEIRRSRFKAEGHLVKEWITYKLEYAFEGSRLIDLWTRVQPKDEFGFQAGQWKIPFNRERVDSSGKQQFVERSIVNRPFTVDRQQGIAFLGTLFKGTHAEGQYSLGVFNGTGRGGDLDEDSEPMYLARYQWNFLGESLGFAQSDTKRRAKPAASLALATATTVGRYTRFSSSGGGQLPGFEAGIAEQYELDQWMGEFALHYRGLSIQAEYHEREIDDRVNNVITELDGYYAQVGYFFHEAFEAFPEPLELAIRTAEVNPVRGVTQPEQRELTLAANWFFNDHKNKLTLDMSDLETTLPGGSPDDGFRVRVQWDVSF